MSDQTLSNSEGRTIKKSLPTFLKSIKFEHTIFALPFAYLALFLVEEGLPSLGNFVWITLAMVGARTFAMGLNRIIDAEVDARNPRTESRPLASGELSRRDALLFSLIALAIFVGATMQLSVLARYLMPVVIIPMVVYPYTKKFTWACHLVLGLVYLMVPPAVWIAVTGQMPLGIVMMGVGAGFWVAGFDILYTCQDLDSDREQGIHSMVVTFGLEHAMDIAWYFHMATVFSIALAGFLLELGPFYYMGVIAFILLLKHEHQIISPQNLSRVNEAFFTMNGIVSVVFFIFVAGDALLWS